MDLTLLYDHEFENVRGDLFLVSSDGDTFRVTGAILFEVSPFLKKVVDNGRMRFNYALTGRISRDTNPNDEFTSMVSFQDNDLQSPVLTFPDVDTKALILLLNTIYPVSHRQTLSTSPSLDFQLISSLLKAGTKYQIPLIVKAARRGLHPTAGPAQVEFYKNGPNALRAFVFARANKLKEETLLAARETLRFPHPLMLPGEYIPELESLTAGDYHRLADYHSRVSKKIQALFALPEPNSNARDEVQALNLVQNDPVFLDPLQILQNSVMGIHRGSSLPAHPWQYYLPDMMLGGNGNGNNRRNAGANSSLNAQQAATAGNRNATAGTTAPANAGSGGSPIANNSGVSQSVTAVNETESISGSPPREKVENDDISLFKRFPSLLGCSSCMMNAKQWGPPRHGGMAGRGRCHPYAHTHAHPFMHHPCHNQYPTLVTSANVRGVRRNAKSSTCPAYWWTTYVDKVLPVLSQSPLTDNIFSIGFLKETAEAMMSCSQCSDANDAFANFDVIVSIIKEERDKLVKEVSPEFELNLT